ncbi:hypothetical protein ACFQT0_26485 [Hymenobacter humi]|uniref:RHS repeat-associated core domain-containing protein n=1 Tax=Hymenobacter humi TaxID=1411620 RepID=A0ABW2UDV1_9BACT
MRTDYLGGFQYEADSLRFFAHAAGRVLRQYVRDPAGQVSTVTTREYTVSDHLGNLRLAYRSSQRVTYKNSLNRRMWQYFKKPPFGAEDCQQCTRYEESIKSCGAVADSTVRIKKQKLTNCSYRY